MVNGFTYTHRLSRTGGSTWTMWCELKYLRIAKCLKSISQSYRGYSGLISHRWHGKI
jgi:hypothetical protein